MSDGMFGYTGDELNCYQAHCWRWGHDFGDEVCKRCGDPVAETTTTGNMLDLINAAISQGAKAGDTFTIADSQGKSQRWTLGETIPAPDRKMLVAFAVKES